MPLVLLWLGQAVHLKMTIHLWLDLRDFQECFQSANRPVLSTPGISLILEGHLQRLEEEEKTKIIYLYWNFVLQLKKCFLSKIYIDCVLSLSVLADECWGTRQKRRKGGEEPAQFSSPPCALLCLIQDRAESIAESWIFVRYTSPLNWLHKI